MWPFGRIPSHHTGYRVSLKVPQLAAVLIFSGKSNTLVVLLRNILNYLFASLSISFWNSNYCFKSISWKYTCCFVSCVAIDAVFSASLRTTTVVSLISSCFLLRETFVISWKGDGRVGMMLHAEDCLSAASCEVGWTWGGGSQWKGLNQYLILDHGRWHFLFGVIVTKILVKITDVFRFFETFSPLISFASFATGRSILRSGHPRGDPGLRSGFRSPSLITLSTFVPKSLFKTWKISDLNGFLWDHPNKKVKSAIS